MYLKVGLTILITEHFVNASPLKPLNFNKCVGNKNKMYRAA